MERENVVGMLNDERAGRTRLNERDINKIIEEFGNDDFIIEKVLANHPNEIKNVDEKFRGIESIMRQVVASNPNLIQYAATQELKDELMPLAVRQGKSHNLINGNNTYFQRNYVYGPTNGLLQYASEEWIKNNIDFIIEQNPENLQYAKAFSKDPKVVWQAVKESPIAWKYVDEEFKESEQGKAMMCATDPRYLATHKELIAKPEFALQVLRKNMNALEHMGHLREDKTFLLEAIKTDEYIFKRLDPKFIENPEFVLEAIKANGDVLGQLGSKFTGDPDFMKAVVEANPEVKKQCPWLFRESKQSKENDTKESPIKEEVDKPVKLSKFQQIWQGTKTKVQGAFKKIAEWTKTRGRTEDEKGQTK